MIIKAELFADIFLRILARSLFSQTRLSSIKNQQREVVQTFGTYTDDSWNTGKDEHGERIELSEQNILCKIQKYDKKQSAEFDSRPILDVFLVYQQQYMTNLGQLRSELHSLRFISSRAQLT